MTAHWMLSRNSGPTWRLPIDVENDNLQENQQKVDPVSNESNIGTCKLEFDHSKWLIDFRFPGPVALHTYI